MQQHVEPYLGQMGTQGPVDAAALDAEHDPKVDTAPLGPRRTALRAGVIACNGTSGRL